MCEDSNFEMKLGFIMDFIDNANDEQIGELFNKVVDIVNGKTKPVSIPFQQVNPQSNYFKTVTVPLVYKFKTNYEPEITCDGCLGCDEDEGNWYDLYRR